MTTFETHMDFLTVWADNAPNVTTTLRAGLLYLAWLATSAPNRKAECIALVWRARA